jgi:uncharacterized protein YaaQ
MKLILVVVRDTDDAAVIGSLVGKGYRVTRMASTGGFLRKGNVTLMIGVDEEQIEEVVALIRQACTPETEGEQHHATLFVLNAPRFEQI